MKIVKNNIEFKGEKYRAVIKPLTTLSSIIKLYKGNKKFSCFHTKIYGCVEELDYIHCIKKTFEEYSEKYRNLSDLQEWNGVIE